MHRALSARPRNSTFGALALVAWAGLACGTTRTQQPGPALAAPPVRYEMEPVKIEATPTAAGGVQIEAYDAEELFEHGGAALSQSRFDEAIKFYDRLLKHFPESTYTRPAHYNRGLAYRDKREWPAAVDAFRALVERWPDHSDAKDALFQMGACFAELENWPSSAELFARIIERKDLTSDDRIEAIARRAFAQLRLGDLEAAEKTFRSGLAFASRIQGQERLETDFFLAFSQYNLGQISHERFRKVAIRLPEGQMDRDLEEKAGLLLKAQRLYIDTIKYGNPRWASAAGFQVGSLYEEMYDAFVGAPIPAQLDAEGREVYLSELRKKIRILLEKSLRWYRENLLMVERFGVDTDWAEKTRLSYAKLVHLLDPNAAAEIGSRPAQQNKAAPGLGGPSAPPVPQSPVVPEPPRRDEGQPPSGKPSEPGTKRQIL